MCRQLLLLLSAWILVWAMSAQAQAQAIVELSGADKVEINYGLKQYGEKRLSPTTFAMNRKTRLAVQRALNGIGYSVGRPDGKFGARTQAGIRAYQGVRSEPTTGVLTLYQLLNLLNDRALAFLPAADPEPAPVESKKVEVQASPVSPTDASQSAVPAQTVKSDERGLNRVETEEANQTPEPMGEKLAAAEQAQPDAEPSSVPEDKHADYAPVTAAKVRSLLVQSPDTCQQFEPDPRFVERVIGPGTDTASEQRFAMVVGNGKYEGGIGVLPNPVNDAAAVSAALISIGFKVYVIGDAKHASLSDCANTMAGAMDGAAVALFYYSGHGIQIRDRNYLVAVNATADLDKTNGFVEVQPIIDAITAKSSATLVFLDACRNNPIGDGQQGLAVTTGRGVKRGLARAHSAGAVSKTFARGMLVAYATSPNNVASDGKGNLSPFTSAFVKHVTTPGYPIQRVMSEVGNSVGEATDWSQTPWTRSSLTTSLKLNGNQTLEEAKLASKDWARKSRELLEKGKRTEAMSAAMKGLPSPLTDELVKEFSAAHTALFAAAHAQVVVLPRQSASTGAARISTDRKRVVFNITLPTSKFELQLWDVEKGKKIKSIPTGDSYVQDMSFSPDNRYLMFMPVSASAKLRVFDARNGSEVQGAWWGRGAVAKFHVDNDDRVLTIRGEDTFQWGTLGNQRALGAVSLKRLKQFPKALGGLAVRELVGNLDRNGDVLGFALRMQNNARYIGTYDTRSKRLTKFFQIGNENGAFGLGARFSPDGKSITVSYTVGSQYTFQLWSVAAKRKLAEVPVAGGYALPVFSPDSSILFVDSQTEQFAYFDTRTGETVSNPFRVDDYRIGYNRIYDEAGVPIEYDFTRNQNQVWRVLPTDTSLAIYAATNLPKRYHMEIARDRIRYWDSGAGAK